MLSSFFISCQSFSPFPNAPHEKRDGESVSSPAIPLNKNTSFQHQKTSLVLVLGPGFMKTYAHLGLLQELKKEKIPIKALLGMGWGALMAAFYLENKEKGVFLAEWKSLKLPLKTWMKKGFFDKRIKPQPLSKVQDFIQKHLTLNTEEAETETGGVGEEAEEASLQRERDFACPYISLITEELYWQQHISATSLSPCLALPHFFLPSQGKHMAALFEMPSIIKWVRLHYGRDSHIIFINPLSPILSTTRERIFKKYGS